MVAVLLLDERRCYRDRERVIMPKSSARHFDGKYGGAWLLESVSASAILREAEVDAVVGNSTDLTFKIWQCVCRYLSYSLSIQEAPTEAEFSKRSPSSKSATTIEGIERRLIELAEEIDNLPRRERWLLVRGVTRLAPEKWRRSPFFHPDIFLSVVSKEARRYASGLHDYAADLQPLRERKTDEADLQPGSFPRPFDEFIREMSQVANEIGIAVSASKDHKYSEVSPFVRFVCATLKTYRESEERNATKDWRSIRMAQYSKGGYDDDEIERRIDQELRGNEFAIATLRNHMTSESAASSAISSALGRVAGDQAGGNK